MTAVVDSAVDSGTASAPGQDPAPGHVAILGAGPIGLDAALACADAGWGFTVYESAASVGSNVRAWGHVRLFTPWSMNVSDRMRAHLAAAGGTAPSGDHYPTGAEFAAELLEPLAALPELADRIRTGTQVLSLARDGLLKHEEIASEQRAAHTFRLLVADADGGEGVDHADLVLDCTGSYGRGNTIGDGGILAPGERRLADRIQRIIPDLAADRAQWAGKRILLVGAGKSAQTAARDLAALVSDTSGTSVVWAVRASDPDWGQVPGDPLPERQELVEVAERLRTGGTTGVEVRTGVVVDALRADGDGVAVSLRADDGNTAEIAVDKVLALTGFVGDTALYRQLQVHECYATSAPMNLSAALLAAAGDGPADCLTQTSAGVDALRVPEPNFFVLGMKSYGRNSQFLLRIGYEQVDEVTGAYATG